MFSLQERKWLGNISLENGKFHFEHTFAKKPSLESFKDIMDKAVELEADTTKAANRRHIPDQTLLFSDVASLRWILLPSEVKLRLCSKSEMSGKNLGQSPFHPIFYEEPKDIAPGLGSFAKGTLDELNLPSAINTSNEKSSWLRFKVEENGVDKMEVTTVNKRKIDEEIPEDTETEPPSIGRAIF